MKKYTWEQFCQATIVNEEKNVINYAEEQMDKNTLDWIEECLEMGIETPSKDGTLEPLFDYSSYESNWNEAYHVYSIQMWSPSPKRYELPDDKLESLILWIQNNVEMPDTDRLNMLMKMYQDAKRENRKKARGC